MPSAVTPSHLTTINQLEGPIGWNCRTGQTMPIWTLVRSTFPIFSFSLEHSTLFPSLIASLISDPPIPARIYVQLISASHFSTFETPKMILALRFSKTTHLSCFWSLTWSLDLIAMTCNKACYVQNRWNRGLSYNNSKGYYRIILSVQDSLVRASLRLLLFGVFFMLKCQRLLRRLLQRLKTIRIRNQLMCLLSNWPGGFEERYLKKVTKSLGDEDKIHSKHWQLVFASRSQISSLLYIPLFLSRAFGNFSTTCVCPSVADLAGPSNGQ